MGKCHSGGLHSTQILPLVIGTLLTKTWLLVQCALLQGGWEWGPVFQHTFPFSCRPKIISPQNTVFGPIFNGSKCCHCHLYWQAPKSDICIDRIIRLIGMVLVLATTALIWGQSNHNGEGITMSAVGHHQCFQLMFRRQTTPRRGSTQRQICCQHKRFAQAVNKMGVNRVVGASIKPFFSGYLYS